MRKKKLVERARVLRDVRAFFDARDFLEVETPTLVPSPGMDLHLDAFPVEAGTPENARTLYLGTSPEYQMKRLLADGYARIFQIGRAYRRGEAGAQHNPEFTMLEWYRANAGVEDVMRDTEELVAAVTGGAVVIDGFRVDTTPPFARLTVSEAFARFGDTSEEETLRIASEDEDRFFRLLVERVEPAIAKLEAATFLVDYPAPMASLARKKPSDPRVAERFELYVHGLELCNGFGELTDATEQRARFAIDQAERRSRKMTVYPIDEAFLSSMKNLPPSGGNALGLDRLVALACGTKNIGDVIAFTTEET
ncbi:EF-P lysine aminoacylase EpmA [soil metagenome]